MRLPPEIIVFFTSMTPFLDIKLSIPLGLSMGLSKTTTLIFAASGSIIFSAVTFAMGNTVTAFLRKHFKFWDRFFERVFKKTREDHSKTVEKYGSIAILTFVALPLPGSGGGAGAFIAYVFGMEYWKSVGLISIGVVFSALLLVFGVDSIFTLFSKLTQ